MNITVLEYLCCGGLLSGSTETQSKSLPESVLKDLLSEGFAMWQSVVQDLLMCGHSVHSVVDPSAENLFHASNSLAKCDRLILSKFDALQSLESNWERATSDTDRVVVIAPEFDCILMHLINHLRERKRVVISPSRHFLKVASDKWLTYQSLREYIAQPKTCIASDLLDTSVIDKRCPSGYILKPRDGAGGGGCNKVGTWSELLDVVDRIDKPSDWLIQEWQQGIHCSAAIAIDENGVMHLVGATEQLIRFDKDSFHYLGARGPLCGSRLEGLENWCQEILSLIPGAFGWIGIDYIQVDRESPDRLGQSALYNVNLNRVLIEINPRLTTSYLLYRQLYGHLLGRALIGLNIETPCVLQNELTEPITYLVSSV